jgi:hypothetical protein
MKLPTYLIVAFSLTGCHPAYSEEYYAYAPNQIGGNTMLTENPCRYDITLPEAYSTNQKGDKAYGCYWLGNKVIYFKDSNGHIRYMEKKDFILTRNML